MSEHKNLHLVRVFFWKIVPFLSNLITLVLRAPWTDFDNFWFFRKTKICSFAQSSFLRVCWRGFLAKNQTRGPTKPEKPDFRKMCPFLSNLITLVLRAPWTEKIECANCAKELIFVFRKNQKLSKSVHGALRTSVIKLDKNGHIFRKSGFSGFVG